LERGVPFPHQLWSLGSVVSIPSGVWGEAPAADAFFGIFEASEHFCMVESTVPTKPVFVRKKIHLIEDWGHMALCLLASPLR